MAAVLVVPAKKAFDVMLTLASLNTTLLATVVALVGYSPTTPALS